MVRLLVSVLLSATVAMAGTQYLDLSYTDNEQMNKNLDTLDTAIGGSTFLTCSEVGSTCDICPTVQTCPGAGTSCPALCGCDICPQVAACTSGRPETDLCTAIRNDCAVRTFVTDEGDALPHEERLNCTGTGIACNDNPDTASTDIVVQPALQACITINPSDIHFQSSVPMLLAPGPRGVRILSVMCRCDGLCTAPVPQWEFAQRPFDQNARVLSFTAIPGPGTETHIVCASGGDSTRPTVAVEHVTAATDTDRDIEPGVGLYAALAFSVPPADDELMVICAQYTPL